MSICAFWKSRFHSLIEKYLHIVRSKVMEGECGACGDVGLKFTI